MIDVVKIRHLVSDTDRHGNVRYYIRIKGCRKIRINRTPGTAAFHMACSKAILDSKPPKVLAKSTPNTLGWLIDQYQNSPEFAALARNTIKERNNILRRLNKAIGSVDYSIITKRDIVELRNANADRPSAANKFVKILRYVFGWADDNDIFEGNPARDVKLLKEKGEGFIAWTIDDMHSFLAHHGPGTMARLAFLLFLYTGQRRSDVVRFGWAHVNKNAGETLLQFTQKKGETQKPVQITMPIGEVLADAIDNTETGDVTFLVTQRGKPFSSAGFGSRFKSWCESAGVYGKTAHGIRKGVGGLVADGQGTENEIMALLGHSTHEQASLYTRSATNKRLTTSALVKLDTQISVLFEDKKSHL